MQITRQADYAVRAVLYLARLGMGNRAATSTIAEDQHIPPSFLAKIVSQLSIAGLLHTSRGARGGVTLARNSEDITLLEVVEAIDGPIRLNECAHSDGMCAFSNDCPLVSIWQDAQSDLVNRLGNANFAQFVRKQKKLA